MAHPRRGTTVEGKDLWSPSDPLQAAAPEAEAAPATAPEPETASIAPEAESEPEPAAEPPEQPALSDESESAAEPPEQPEPEIALPKKIRLQELVTIFVRPYPHNPALTVTRVFDPSTKPIITDPIDIALIVGHGADYEDLT